MKTVVDRLKELIEIKESVDLGIELTRQFSVTNYGILLQLCSMSLRDAVRDMQKLVDYTEKDN